MPNAKEASSNWTDSSYLCWVRSITVRNIIRFMEIQGNKGGAPTLKKKHTSLTLTVRLWESILSTWIRSYQHISFTRRVIPRITRCSFKSPAVIWRVNRKAFYGNTGNTFSHSRNPRLFVFSVVTRGEEDYKRVFPGKLAANFTRTDTFINLQMFITSRHCPS